MGRAKPDVIDRPERPISFAKAMVEALLDGRKSQTRRLVAPQPAQVKLDQVPSRFGQPGDRLWVRERWAYRNQLANPKASDGGQVVYAADQESMKFKGAWRQSMYMPRVASRLTLEITSIRIERLHQITDADARAEGFDPNGDCADPVAWFAQLWNSLNTDGLTWRANPWVWVIAFRLLHQTASRWRS